MTTQTKNVLIAGAGSYGFWNTGDEAILAAMINDLRGLVPEVRVAVVSANPPGSLARYGAQEIQWQDITQIINAARASDLMILGGGGLFYDYWGFDPGEVLTTGHAGLGLYTGFAVLATLLDKPLMIYSVGIGPLISEIGRTFTRLAFDQAHIATVRDAESKALLEAIGVDVQRVQVTADPGFTLQSTSEEQSRQIIEAKIERPAARPLLGVALRNWDIGVYPGYWEREVAAALDRFIERYDGTALFIPFHRPVNESRTDDLAVADRVRNQMQNREKTVLLQGEYSPEQKAGVVQACDLVLGMRLHSLIFAIQQGVPVVALSYDPKVSNVLARIDGHPYTLELGSLSAEKLTALLEKAYENRQQLRSSFQAKLEELMTQARENARLAVDLMMGKVSARPALSAPTVEALKELGVKQSLRVHKLWQTVQALQAQSVELTEQRQLSQTLSAQVAEREQMVQALNTKLIERERTLTAQLTEREQTEEQQQAVQTLNAQLAGEQEAARLLSAQLVEKEQQVQALSAHLVEKEQVIKRLWTQVTAITDSRGWTLLQELWRVRSWLTRQDSGRKQPAEVAVPIAPEAEAEPVSRVLEVVEPEQHEAEAEPVPIVLEQVVDPEQHEAETEPIPLTIEEVVAPEPPKQQWRVNQAPPAKDSRRVPIATTTFFDFDGNNMFFGGAERYLIELARLVRELGYEPEVYQCAHGSWVRYYDDLRVTGIAADGDMQRFNEQFHELVPEGILTIYLAFFLAAPHYHSHSIGISHGVYWDHALYHTAPEVLQGTLAEIFLAFSNVTQMVSVDTNTINWTRGLWQHLAKKFTYIPNFVDPEQFAPGQHNGADAQSPRVRVLYPRRLYEPRGFWLVADLIPEFVEKYPEVDFHFVGKAGAREEEAVRKLTQRYPDRVQWHFLPPERMPEAYQQVDITLVPTVSSEGTSLSCLEALSSGNAVIATNVGGLPDLVLSEHNGLLIEPSSASLRKALARLIEDPALRRRLSQCGRQSAQAFNLERWREQWRQILRPHLPAPPASKAATTRVAFFPTAPGLSWEPIQQRPHHLARQLAAHGIETFWGNPDGRQPSPVPHLHIVDPRDDLYLKAPLLVIYYPFHLKEIEKFDRAFVIYDVLDDISIHDQSDAAHRPIGQRARDYHVQLLDRADLVVTSSQVLYQQLQAQRPDVVLVPNGVDLQHFARDTAPAEAMAKFARPVIGYHGAIAEWFDANLLYEVVRQQPQYQFVLIGPVAPPELLAQLQRQPNVHYLGIIPYQQIPSYVAGFDVGILPFVSNPLTEGVRPLKVLEYLAMGKPAVATPLPELTDWPGVLPARTADEFAAQLDAALQLAPSLKHDAQLAAFLAASSWPTVIQPLLHALDARVK